MSKNSLAMDLPEKFMLFHTFLDVEHSKPYYYYMGPNKTFNGIQCYIRCHKRKEWECHLYLLEPPLSLLGLKIEFKIRKKNGVETVGTTDGTVRDDFWISFQDDPKYFVDGNLTIECHVEPYETNDRIMKPRTTIENKTEIGFHDQKNQLTNEEKELQMAISLSKKEFEEAIAKEQQKTREQQKKKETLSCNICLLKYGEEGNRTPRVLDCGHTLCLGCCKQIARLAQIQCPFCRVVTHLTGRTVSNLPKNYLALSINTQRVSSLTMDHTGKFMLSHTFHNVSIIVCDAGPKEIINGIECQILCREKDESDRECCLWTYKNPPPSLGWKVEFKIRTKNGVETVGTADGTIRKLPWISFRKDPKYFVDGKMTIECHVEVYEIDGNGVRKPWTVIEKETARLFDESVKEFSDVVLVVEEKKFYVNKLFLASESSYFKSLFIGSFEESKKDEISLKDVEAKYFQLFLESLYGDRVINDETVDGILKLADMFDAQRVSQKCEFYLIKNSKKTLKEKLDLAVKFSSSKLKVSKLFDQYNKCNVREFQGNGSRRVGIPSGEISFSS
ncbi:hypothetical protein CRE_26724 [Caenorhabditis remanei]|uniref:RING-type domain-containing protein n=1 Tax=Caenorhabditis remanei TaxID=31234 RepID=E3MXV7_CAERE|nr:hypothetical protein CRE_26724 [Caenorhabditis remanei]